MTLRILTLEGTPEQMGAAHGEEMRDDIHDVLERWMDHMGITYSTPARELIRDFVSQTSLMNTASRLAPDLVAEMEAISRAADVDLDALWTWNNLDELWWYAAEREEDGRVPDAITCTSIGLRSGPSGVPVVAQNMDLEPFVTWDPVLLRIRPDQGMQALALVNPGGIGLCGCNAAGVAVTCNALSQLRPSPGGLPVTLIVRSILAQPDLASVRALLRDAPHASGQNYLVGGPDGVLAVECSAGGASEVGEDAPMVVHTNHPLANTDVVNPRATENSHDRLSYLEATLAPGDGIAGIRSALSDRTVPVCKTGEVVRTYASIVMDLTAPPSVWVTPGPPGPEAYESVAF